MIDQPSARPSYLRQHGRAMLLSAALSSVLTLLAVFAWGRYQAMHGQEAARLRLQERLLGRWELVEPADEGPGREWVEFRLDGTLRMRAFQTVRADGKLISREEQFVTVGYRVDDGGHITLNPERDDYGRRQARVVLDGDGLTLHDPGQAQVKRYRQDVAGP
jgi:hypothetical protein